MLSSTSNPGFQTPEFEYSDKVAHLVYFAAGGVCVMLGLSTGGARRLPPGIRLAAVILLISAIGGIDEWHQTYTPDRQGGDLYDWIADTLGGLAGGLLGLAVDGKLRAGCRRREAAPSSAS